ncbi:thermophilic serine proteinase precursor [Ruminiclostridium hungatei]|uniref:Thermophilic serine proteinase n=1 Tax=Ruminiclostridium hungatei TaxID=48256 RepID=A0A1V4SPQ1_RUMHU|nr:S8 family serine peptidase [Ruminiclostridium hungatei]OPX45251.1 thermophilic serine proteinase precursor [Ruminiclostridium hungatei]
MSKIVRCISIILLLFFTVQINLSAIVYASETDNVVMEISIPLLSVSTVNITDTKVELVWSGSDSSVLAVSYEIYRNDSLIKAVDSFTYTDMELQPNTSYYYKIKAKDKAGEIVAESNVLDVKTREKQEELPMGSEATDIEGLQPTAVTPGYITVSGDENDLLDKQSSDVETDRFIIKYKKKDIKFNVSKSFDKIEKKLKDKAKLNKIYKHKDFEIVVLDKKQKFKDLADDLKKQDVENDIQYIQPDYQLSLSSDDPYYNSQWGLGKKLVQNDNVDSRISMEYRIKMLPPHLREVVEGSRELRNFLLNTPVEEIREKLIKMDTSISLEPYILSELANESCITEPEYMTYSVLSQNNSYICDAGAEDAWEKSTGNGALIAVIDTGVDVAHEDLAGNVWVNSGEIPGNGLDDDGNGKIDDTNGWNFVDSSNLLWDQANFINENHGTHISGIIAAVKDNSVGISGVAPASKVLPLKVFNNGKAYTSDIINAIQYAESMGAKVVNCSWGSTDENPALKEAIQNSNMLFVCAAGNSGLDIDKALIYPAAFDCPNIITVASVNKDGCLSGFSNYGEGSVDVAAPGEAIISTLTGNSYGEMSGTSMAAAFVSGEAALLLSNSSGMNCVQLKERIVKCSEHLSSLTGKVSGSSKINCINALNDISTDEYINVLNAMLMQSNKEQAGTDELSPFSTSEVSGQFVKVDGGSYFTLALRNDGTVWACGINDKGQLGNNSSTGAKLPVNVVGLYGITSIAACNSHGIALRNDGTVWTWGYNVNGQLGDATTETRLSPVQVKGLSEITAIAGGADYCMALRSDGTVWAWGYNFYGQLGDGTTINKATAVQVSGLSGVKAIACGSYHSLALKDDGTVWAWGYNYYGQIGDGTTASKAIAVQVAELEGIASISAGDSHSLALKNDGTVSAWGGNYYGQLGDGTTTSRTTPIQVNGLDGVMTISAGYAHNLVLKNDGTVLAWGKNSSGQLGDGTTANKSVPILVMGLNDAASIGCGYEDSLAVKTDGTVWVWGLNSEYGQLGKNVSAYRTSPVKTNNLSEVKAIAEGNYHSLALKNDGTVWSWGYNSDGQLGDGTTAVKSSPIQVSGISGITAISAGENYSLALRNDGTVWAWGSNNYGQLGDGTTDSKLIPTQVSGLSGITAIAAADEHSLAVKNDGTVWAWGRNSLGALGDGSQVTRTSPVQVSGLDGIIAVSGGSDLSVALKNDGTVWAWGYSVYGRMGNGGSEGVKTTPVRVNTLSGITAIDTCDSHNVALKNDGTVWEWGLIMVLPTRYVVKSIPEKVSGLSGIVSVSKSMALKDDGTVWTWGDNEKGQLGDGTTIARETPEYVREIIGVSAISGRLYTKLAVKNDGTVWAWGYNCYGQLGNGEMTYYANPEYSFGTLQEFQPISSAYEAACTKDKEFSLVFKLKNINDFTRRTFTVTYDPSEISSVSDLSRFTYLKEKGIGTIAGTGITILQNDPGVIRFKVDKPIPAGKTWSGVLNVIVLKAAVTGPVTLSCRVE